jgi:hypothetical protein
VARKYSVSSGLTSLAASTTIVACQLATSTTVTLTILGFDISFDSTATGAGAIPVRVQLARPTAASSGGATMTPTVWNKGDLAAQATARKNDTAAGTSPTVIKEWLVSPTAGFSYLFPQGREITMPISDFLELKLISQAGMTTCNYIGNLDLEE